MGGIMNNESIVSLDKIALEKSDVVNKLESYKGVSITTPEVHAILASIDTDDLSTITKYGESIANEINAASDVILNSSNFSQLDKTSKLMVHLTKIMESCDVKEIIKEEPKGIMKIFFDIEKHFQKIMDKYTTVGDEIEGVYIELRKYEDEINKSNRYLEDLFKSCLGYYENLVKYIMAGEEGLKLIDNQIALVNTSERGMDKEFTVNSLENAKRVFEQRLMDLRMVENAALQSIPMIKTLIYTNAMLSRKINSAFIVTIPIFKQGVAQAITAKRQKIQADSLKALDDATNKMFEENARNIIQQGKDAVELANSTTLKMDVLERSWNTIMTGLDEIKNVSAQIQAIQEQDRKRLADLNNSYWSKALNIK